MSNERCQKSPTLSFDLPHGSVEIDIEAKPNEPLIIDDSHSFTNLHILELHGDLIFYLKQTSDCGGITFAIAKHNLPILAAFIRAASKHNEV
jgi:hypothetical protein